MTKVRFSCLGTVEKVMKIHLKCIFQPLHNEFSQIEALRLGGIWDMLCDIWWTKWGFFYSKREQMDPKNKMRKLAKNSQFWTWFGAFEWLNPFRPNFAPFLRIMMVGKLKSPAIARNQIFCVKNVDFLPNLGQNVP